MTVWYHSVAHLPFNFVSYLYFQKPQRRTVQIESSTEEEGEIQQDDDSDAMSSFASSLASGSKDSKMKSLSTASKKEGSKVAPKGSSEESGTDEVTVFSLSP